MVGENTKIENKKMYLFSFIITISMILLPFGELDYHNSLFNYS